MSTGKLAIVEFFEPSALDTRHEVFSHTLASSIIQSSSTSSSSAYVKNRMKQMVPNPAHSFSSTSSRYNGNITKPGNSGDQQNASTGKDGVGIDFYKETISMIVEKKEELSDEISKLKRDLEIRIQQKSNKSRRIVLESTPGTPS